LPVLQWLSISDLVVDQTVRRPIAGNARRHVDRIAQTFSWSCFATVIVTPLEGGKFAIIDGQRRTAAAALAGFDKVPCQIISVCSREQRAVAFKALNGSTTAASRMTLHAAAVAISDPLAVRLADACARAQVELLRYPVPIDRQAAGQTMAVGTLLRCLRRYGEETLITALQCVTQTINNKPGVLSARTIKALCSVLASDAALRDSGIALLEIFDRIDLKGLAEQSASDAAAKRMNSAQVMADRLRLQIGRLGSSKTRLAPTRKLETPREKIRRPIGLRSSAADKARHGPPDRKS
jgi:hypothetical protein